MANEFKVKNGIKFSDGSVQNTAASGGSSTAVSNTPPSSPANGALWWDSEKGSLKVYYDDGSSSQWVDAFNNGLGVSSGTGGGGIIWTESNTNVTASIDTYYLLDTTSNVITVTLPASPTEGHEIGISDKYGTFAVNSITVNANGSYFQDDSELTSIELNETFGAYRFIYLDSKWFVLKSTAFKFGGASPIPVLLASATSEYESADVTVTITNYIEYTGSYSVSVTGGSYTRQAETIVWTLPALATNTNHTITVTYTVSGTSVSGTATVTVLALPSNADTAVVWDLTTSSYSDGWV